MRSKIEFLKLPNGKEPFKQWLDNLDTFTRRRISSYIYRFARGGTTKNIKSLGDGVFEIKIKHGPGYRVYFGQKNDLIILLLLGGDKHSQFKDIRKAKDYWRKYV